MIEVREREPFVQLLEERLGRTLSPSVRRAFLQVPRHLFVQQYYEQRGNSLSWDLVQATPEKIYRDEALVTQIDGRGMPSSSTSQPSLMAAQLEALALSHGHRVLEIGVGTGYNAALLGELVGDTGQVISIDIDEGLVERAKQHLVQAQAFNVVALAGDGFVGEVRYAPYDRLLATCSIRFVPHAWFEQLKPGGRLVGNWLTHLASLFICVEKRSQANWMEDCLTCVQHIWKCMPRRVCPRSKRSIGHSMTHNRRSASLFLGSRRCSRIQPIVCSCNVFFHR